MANLLDRKRGCAFTGHRPEKLKQAEEYIISALYAEIQYAIADGFDTFISGMARGVDIWAAEIVLRLRNERASIQLICACPYKGFEDRWSVTWKSRYRSILQASDQIVYINPK